ncbi:Glycoside hydrolase [Mycena sanguinolenta]|uniref:glucan 1,3-beta-glucosidase n=1 Tax=Mycena sanguinolenta TaxID=230812 RepID=A0A8H6XP21_9AGAR|nr:Glycoside hydrolase [Mycena sanguinolenta]
MYLENLPQKMIEILAKTGKADNRQTETANAGIAVNGRNSRCGGQNDYYAPAPYPPTGHGSSVSLASYSSEQGYPSNEHGYSSNGYPSNGYPSNGYPSNEHGYAPSEHGYPSSQHGYPSHEHIYADSASAYADSTYNLNPSGAGRRPYHDSSYQEPVLSSALPNEKRATYLAPKSRGRRKRITIGLVALLFILGAAGAALYFFVFKKKDASTTTADSSSGPVQSNIAVAVTGGDGSTITADDGSNFTYTNPFGGTWYWDANDPFNNGARPQSWSPALNETFNFGADKIRGVNIGGWLVTEPFITPALYQTVQASAPSGITVVDEYTLLQAGGQAALEDHYKTFITEQDFMQIAAAGLNFVRIPIAYWAIEVLEGEGFLANVSWTYFLKAIQWARKYGLRINVDLHALPGSQNGWNHSGRLGTYNVLYGPMGIANAQRSLDYIRIIAEFISQPEYSPVITMFGVTNEPWGPSITQDILSRYYLQAYNNVRLASGIGAGNGPFVSFHEGFLGPQQWSGFLPNADRASLDMHTYLCFQGQEATPVTGRTSDPCNAWGSLFNSTMTNFGMIVAGEWSLALTDCGLYVNGVGLGTRYEGDYPGSPTTSLGNCTTDWLDWQNWDAPTKAGYMALAQSSMDALQRRRSGPTLSGLEQGWMPTDPRAAVGQCGNTSPWEGPLASWQTGGAGAGSIPATVSSSLAWPPPSIYFANSAATPGNLLPTYSAQGTPVTLPGPTFTITSAKTTTTANAGDGWENAADQAGMMAPIPGCSYYDPWVGSSFAPPSPLCTSSPRRRAAAAAPVITAPPQLKR